MTIEQRLEQLEKRNKGLTVALTMMAVTICAVVTMAATGLKNANFDTVTARRLFVANDAGELVVTLDTDDSGNGLVLTHSAKGKDLVALTRTDTGGSASTYRTNGKMLVRLTSTADSNGGFVQVFNKTGENIVQMHADEYGNGVVWAGNRKGKGRTLQPGP